MPAALLVLLAAPWAAAPAAPQQRFDSFPERVERFRLDAHAWSGALSPDAAVDWLPGLAESAAHQRSEVLFVQSGPGSVDLDGGAGSEAGVGDLVLLRPGERARFRPPLDVLRFRLAQPLPDGLPAVIRPDHDPRITDTPGGCATEAGAYRRVCLTWEGKNGPYLYHALNAHRVRIRDSFSHYHPVDGGFDEIYLVQDALPGAEIVVSERLPELLDPSGLEDAADAAGLLRRVPVRAGDLVLLPRGTVHRGLGGVLAQVITLPGFVPGAEIGVDEAIRAVNARFGTALPHHDPGAPFVAVLERADRVRVEVGDELFTEYRFDAGPRAFFHPLRLADGRRATRGYPLEPQPGEARDHPHHQGLWFAHGAVDGVDFWHDPEAGMPLVRVEEVFSRSGLGGFTAVHEWRAPDGRLVLRDRRRFRFHAPAAGTDGPAERWIDWDLELTAPDDRAVRFGDTKEGTMALRVAAPLRVEGEVARGNLLNSAGDADGAAWGKRAAWLLARGPLGDAPAAVALLEHPQNFRFPTWWHAREYGLLAANPFGRHDFEGAARGAGDFVLEAGRTLRLRYRFVFAAGELDAAAVASRAAAYGGAVAGGAER